MTITFGGKDRQPGSGTARRAPSATVSGDPPKDKVDAKGAPDEDSGAAADQIGLCCSSFPPQSRRSRTCLERTR